MYVMKMKIICIIMHVHSVLLFLVTTMLRYKRAMNPKKRHPAQQKNNNKRGREPRKETFSPAKKSQKELKRGI